MQGHVTDERWIDVIDGAATAHESAHLASCLECGKTLSELRLGIAAARSAEVPEPSPLYWQALRRNVDERIVGEGVERSWLPRLLGWRPALAGLAALALIVALYPGRAPREARPTTLATLPAWDALPPTAEDQGLAVLQGLGAAEEDLVGVASSSVIGLVDELSEAETEALVHELRSGLAGRRS